jgi:hypothetical protein
MLSIFWTPNFVPSSQCWFFRRFIFHRHGDAIFVIITTAMLLYPFAVLIYLETCII